MKLVSGKAYKTDGINTKGKAVKVKCVFEGYLPEIKDGCDCTIRVNGISIQADSKTLCAI